MEKTVYHKIPKKISAEGLKELENLKRMDDDAIDYSDAPPLNEKQLKEAARIVRERKESLIAHNEILAASSGNAFCR
jgi:hypothetical protein